MPASKCSSQDPCRNCERSIEPARLPGGTVNDNCFHFDLPSIRAGSSRVLQERGRPFAHHARQRLSPVASATSSAFLSVFALSIFFVSLLEYLRRSLSTEIVERMRQTLQRETAQRAKRNEFRESNAGRISRRRKEKGTAGENAIPLDRWVF
jgi:hypothetical protein